MTTTIIPSSIVLSVPSAATNPYVYCKDNGSVGYGSDSVFNPLVKIAVQQATVDSKYVHLRFTYNNKYWKKNADDNSIVAVSNQTVEDTTDPSCTLFEPSLNSDNQVSFTHVQTGWAVVVNDSTNSLHVDQSGSATLLWFVDGDTIVQLPTHIALKGDNGKYLKAYHNDGSRLQFGSDDPNLTLSGHTVTLMPTGQVRINSNYYNGLWWMDLTTNWLFSDWDTSKAPVATSYFWPVKIDDVTIALRNTYSNKFCNRLSAGGFSDCLGHTADTIETSAKMQVQELVSRRTIYNVVYAMENAMIYDEYPFIAGETTVTNIEDEEASMAVSITYEVEKSYTFSRGASMSLGMSVTMEAGIPFIMDAKIEMSGQISGSLQWDTTTKTKTSVTSTGTVPVPAHTTVTLSYVGTKGTCNIPYTYTQEDTSSTTGEITRYNQTDGTYNGVSCYNFDFQVKATKPT